MKCCHRPAGEPQQPHPLQTLADLADSSGAGYDGLAGVLTATYPDMWREDLGKKVCVRYPNGGERGDICSAICTWTRAARPTQVQC